MRINYTLESECKTYMRVQTKNLLCRHGGVKYFIFLCEYVKCSVTILVQTSDRNNC